MGHLESRTVAFSGIIIAHSLGRWFWVWRYSIAGIQKVSSSKRPSLSALTMLPTLPISLLVRPGLMPGVPADARLDCFGQGVSLLTHHTSSCQDSSAAKSVVVGARLRASVHVVFKTVHCPVGDRGELPGSSENHLRQRPSHTLGSCARRGETTIAARIRRTATLRRSACHFHSAPPRRCNLQFSIRRPQPLTRQGGSPNQERNRTYEERNVGQCLAARGVPHRHR